VTPLDILRLGAVTPLGLAAPSTCAAFRAGVKALQNVFHGPFPTEPIVGGRAPGGVSLRRTYAEWLVNLASRALVEALDGFDAVNDTALILNLPEPARNHSQLGPGYADAILDAVQRQSGVEFGIAEAVCGGHSGALAGIVRARELLSAGTVRFCCIGGVDSLVNAHDIERLRAEHRLRDENSPLGVMPSEGAGFFLVSLAGSAGQALSRILGVGVSQDAHGATRSAGLRDAFEAAINQGGVHESQIDFIVSDHTGERSRALDYMIAEMRTFRTIRESMPRWTLAEFTGDTAAAAGALALILAVTAHAKHYAPGPLAMCAASSDSGANVACIVQGVTG
jgi:3-oxoacyl-[acyl-carrier-protein] synthase-1